MIIVRMTPTVPKTALAGVTLESSLARFMAAIAAFNEERATSRRFGRWDFVAMAETRGSEEKGAQRVGGKGEPGPNRDERSFCHGAPHANGFKEMYSRSNSLKRQCDRLISLDLPLLSFEPS